MAEDILNRLKKHTIKGRKRINGRHRYCTWCDIIDEIEQLRAAGDEMADAATRQQWSRLDVAVAAWNEARRG